VPHSTLNGDLNARVGGTLNLCLHGVDGEAVLHELDRAGVQVSTGSACSSGQQAPSHVLLAMGLSPEDAHASVRFSLAGDNTMDEIERIGDVLPPVVERLRALAGPGLERSA
jgi:cysteine desulfurase